ncbi:glycosyltransferase family 2 protein [Alkalicoccobacillus murimartini]|uniref:Glycosyltransferase involved in cell wall biosynthesis n=1 Tax=Alkalicoccobacillus murimartini TaxID=171685 RepID=A0ABT9YLI2_9BACI|nr:glycosyltransferase family 2 protein [Alkalicoccobacillus murimartini]MDQ0208601.1 glycosyltransferase involved in cell wall biosynthesis [Alkalicoccobacillus murimartini]
MKHLISIVIPVYDVEDYLTECVNSIVNQSYSNLEIILVNDKSTDNSGVICDTLAKQDARIKVYHNTINSGLSDTRNLGTNKANGDYIIYIDSDDYISSNMVEVLYDLCIKYKCCIAQCAFTRDGNMTEPIEDLRDTQIYSGKEMHLGLIGKGTSRTMACGKIFKRSLFKEVSFPSKLIHEDEAFIHKVLYRAEQMIVTNEKLYFYRKNPESIMNKKFSIKKYDILIALQDRILFYQSLDWHDLAFATSQRYSVTIIELYRKTNELITDEKTVHLEYLSKLYKENLVELKKSPYLTSEKRRLHDDWKENPLEGDTYNFFEYFSNTKI